MTMEKMGIIIYARTTSRRLPGKVLKVLNNKKMLLELVYDRVKKNQKTY
jgi:spore coat polysaccharide biosynthesis protein SpsF (cytidylyltransferase family)